MWYYVKLILLLSVLLIIIYIIYNPSIANYFFNPIIVSQYFKNRI